MQLNEIQRLKILRAKHNLSQKEIAEALDMTPQGYSYLEKGKISLSRTHLQLLKDKLNFDIDYITNGSDQAPVSNSSLDLLEENKTLKAQVSELLSMVRDLTNSVNMLSQKLGKLKGNPIEYADEKGKLVPFMSDSVTHMAKAM